MKKNGILESNEAQMLQTMVTNSGQRPGAGMPPQASGGQSASRLDRWLGSDDGDSRIIEITPEMLASKTPQEIAKIAMRNLAIFGSQQHAFFKSKLPSEHKLITPKEFTPVLLPKSSYLGRCKVGEVLLARSGDKALVHQMFTANFLADINTSGKGDLFNLHNKNIGNTPKMFFGMNVIIDRNGPIGFDLSRGKNGITFQTENQTEAAWEIAAAATGQTVEQLREKLARKAR